MARRPQARTMAAPVHRTADGAELFDDSSHRQLRHTILTPGSRAAWMGHVQLEGVRVSFGQFDFALMTEGRMGHDDFIFIKAGSGRGGSVASNRLSGHVMCVVGPDADFVGAGAAGTPWVSVSAKESVVRGLLPSGDTQRLPARDAIRVVRPPIGGPALGALEEVVTHALDAEATGSAQTESASDLVGSALVGLLASPPAPQDARFEESRRIVSACLERVRRRGSRPTGAEICALTGVSERRVRYAFGDVLAVPAHTAMRSIRLHEVREEIRAAAEGQTVGGIANAWGFSHRGRFSRYYRDLFGVSAAVELGARTAPLRNPA